MSARCTPGPWITEFTGHNDVDGDFAIETAIIRGVGNLVVAEVEPHHESIASVVANANLIAAAPELLDALKALVAQFDPDGQWEGAAAAIAKATQS